MITLAEYLRSEGATEEDLKLLDTPLARKAFDKQQAAVEAAAAEKARAADVIKRNQEWAVEVEENNQKYLKERDSALVKAAALEAQQKKMTELGLIEIAEKMEPGSTKTEQKTEPATFDPSKYVDRDTLMQVAEREGDAIATAQDIAFEHQRLFGTDPTKRLNFRELRKEALSRKISVEQLWMDKYPVQATRDRFAADERAAYEKKIADDAVARYRSENSQTNPMTGIPVISRTPFTAPASEGQAGKQPWQTSEAAQSNSRVQKVLESLNKQGLVN